MDAPIPDDAPGREYIIILTWRWGVSGAVVFNCTADRDIGGYLALGAGAELRTRTGLMRESRPCSRWGPARRCE